MPKVSPTALSIATFSLILSAGIYFLVIPQLKELQKNFDASESSQQSAVSLSSKSSSSSSLTYSQAQLVQSLLPATDNSLDLRIQIEALAKARGLTLSSLQVGAAATTSTASAPKTVQAQKMNSQEAGASLKKVPIAVMASGSYENLQRLVSDLAYLDRFIQIDQTSIAMAADGAVTAQVTASAFYLP